MRIVRPLIYSLALTVVLFIGCETTHRVQQVGKPTARVVGLKIQGVKEDEATLLFGVEIDNPYAASLSLVSLSYSLTSGGGTFIAATPIDQATVPPNTRQIVVLSDEVIYVRLLKALNSKPGSIAPYEARLWLQVDIPRLGSVELLLIYEGRLALPNAPEVTKEDDSRHTTYLGGSPRTRTRIGFTRSGNRSFDGRWIVRPSDLRRVDDRNWDLGS